MIDMESLQAWIQLNPLLALGSVLLASLLTFLIARGVLARGLAYLASRSKNKIDDILVQKLRPFRIAWLAPLIIIYLFADLVPDYQFLIEKATLFVILWIAILTINALMDALNTVYESSSRFSGVSIQGYLDIVKIVVLIAGVILSVSLFTGESPVALLTGLGALTAVLLLVFRDTILSFVASVQINAHDLVKEGDWIEVPSFQADGDVIDMTLHTITVQNWDKTISVIPTHKIMEVAYKNWRGMQESGGRRIKRSINIDLGTIRFCDEEMLARFRNVDILQDYLDRKLTEIQAEHESKGVVMDSPLDGRQLTNLGTFRAYVEEYLRNHPRIHQEGMTFLVRQLAPGPKGVPVEIYVFTKTTEWVAYEKIQADIFDHLLASVPIFDLRVFQEPTGMDFKAGLVRG
jgi:miniconductance mechanosensitive channel